MLKHPGKARDRTKEVFGEAPKTAHGVRCFVMFRLAMHGLDKIKDGIILFCINNKVSEVSSDKMNLMLNGPQNDTEAVLGMAMIKMAAICKRFVRDTTLFKVMLSLSYKLNLFFRELIRKLKNDFHVIALVMSKKRLHH